MNHYEIVFIFNPDQKELGSALFSKVLEVTKNNKGVVHRSEEIGSRRLAYPIKDFFRGEYFLLNIECDAKSLASINELFKFNENILRSSVLKKKKAETSKSALMEQSKEASSYEENKDRKSFSSKVSSEAKKIVSKAEEVVEEVKEVVEKAEEVVEEVVEEVKEVVEKAEEVLEEVVEEVVEEVKEVVEKAEEVVEEVVEEAKEKASGVFAKVKNVFKSDKK